VRYFDLGYQSQHVRFHFLSVIMVIVMYTCIIHVRSVTGEEVKAFSFISWNRVCEFAHLWQDLDGYEAEISCKMIGLFQEKCKYMNQRWAYLT